MADPNLNKNYPEKDLNQVVAIAAMCLQEESAARPLMSDVVTALSFLSTSPPPEAVPAPLPPPNCTSQKSVATADESESEDDNDSHSSDEERSVHEDKKSITATSAKHQEYDDVSDTEGDYYDNENQHDYSSQDAKETKEFYSKSSCKSSTKSRKGTVSSGRRNNSSSDSENDHESSRRKHEVDGSLTQKSSKKSAARDLSQKSSKKSTVTKDLSQKSSKKSSARVVSRSSHSSSDEESHDGGVLLKRGDSRPSHDGNGYSFGLVSSDSEEGSHFDRTSTRGSEEGSFHHFQHSSSRKSDEGSVHSR